MSNTPTVTVNPTNSEAWLHYTKYGQTKSGVSFTGSNGTSPYNTITGK
jgi:hypothetical protein